MFPFITESAVRVPRTRRRPARSCVDCRRRKVKCDQKKPCDHCVLSKTPCIYSTEPVQAVAPPKGPNAPTFSAASLATTPLVSETGPSRDLSTFQRSESEPSSTLLKPADFDSGGEKSSLTYPSILALKKEIEFNELNRRVQTLEQLLSVRTPSFAVGRLCEPDPLSRSEFNDASHSKQDRRVALNKSRLFGQSHWTNATHEFRKIASALSSEAGSSIENEATRRLKSEIPALLQKCKLFARSMKTSRPSRCFSFPQSSLLTTEKDFADQMAHLYISRFESALRILHIPSFWNEYEQYWRNPGEAASALQFKIQLVIAIGSSLYRESHDATKVRSAACQSLHAAQNWLAGPMEKDRLSISGLQVQCLLILARQTLSVGGDLIWVAMGTVVRTAMQMGLHRDPKHFMKMTVLQAEIRRRLWATILELNVQASLDSGVPPGLSFDDFDTDPPSDANDNDIYDCTGALKQCPRAVVTDASLQRFLFKCLRSRFEILRRMNGLGSELSYDELLALTSAISNACHECSAHVRKDDEAEVEIFRYNMADLLLRRFLLCLHRPFASRARTNPLFYYSRKICLDSAIALLSPTPHEEFSHLVLLGGGLFKNRIIHASLVVASELLDETDDQRVNSFMQAPLGSRKMLVDALKEACRQLALRMQLGETNARLQMKLSIILSQAECTEAGTPLQQRMVQGAKDSLEMSYSTLQALSGSTAACLHSNGNFLTSQNVDEQEFPIGFDFDDIFRTTDFVMDGTFGPGPPFC